MKQRESVKLKESIKQNTQSHMNTYYSGFKMVFLITEL